MSKNKRSQYVGACLCESHGKSENLSPKQFTLVPHHTEQRDDEEIACDLCTVAIMRQNGAL